jgi:Demerecviridae HNH endonuclease
MLDQQYLKSIFDYDPETGILRSRVFRANNKAKPGDIVGTNVSGYIQLMLNGKMYRAHRIIWTYMTGEDPGDVWMDHKNLVRDDNRWKNLRLATPSQNGINRKKFINNTSGYKGVSYHKRSKKYVAQIRFQGKSIWIGHYPTAEEAGIIYQAFAQELFGEYARW